MDTSLNTIKDRFPNLSGLIDSLYQKNASFHSLCDDYLTVVEKIRQHSASEISISSADLEEIKTLLSELEQEMVIYFEEDQKAQELKKIYRPSRI